MKEPSRVTVTGPLEPYARGFCDRLSEQGYARDSAVPQVQLMAHLSRWMASEHLPAADLQREQVEQFARARRAAGYERYRSSAALNPLLDYLRALDVVPTPVLASPETPGDAWLARYHGYLVGERSLAEGTIRYYARIARLFRSQVDGPDLSQLTTAEVSRFVLEECRRRKVGSAKTMVMALRSWLRFLDVEGLTVTRLAGAVPAMAPWRASTWLGHETVRTTQIYLHADLRLKERALARTAPPHLAPGRYRPPDSLLAFLESL